MKAAATPDLIKCAVGAAANARDLLGDAEALSASGRHARAYALAALAVEESGKAASLASLAMMPAGLRERAPVGRLLEWHQLKLVGGMLIAAVPFSAGCLAFQLPAMPASQVAELLGDAQALADEQDRLKQLGLYADMDGGGRVRLPSEVTEADVAAQLDRARLAVSSASVLLGPSGPAFLTNPPAETIELCRAMISAFSEAGYSRTSQAAANVWLDAVGKLRQRTAALDVTIR